MAGVTVTGLEQAKARIAAVQARLQNLQPVLAVAAQDTITLIDDSFAGSRTPEGMPWAPLSAKTLARRRGGSGNPLIDTSVLRNSKTAVGYATGLRFGTVVPYAPPQQWGYTRTGTLKRWAPLLDGQVSSRRGRGKGTPYEFSAPARPFLPVRRVGSGFALMTVGPAGAHWRRVRAMVRDYIATGRVS